MKQARDYLSEICLDYTNNYLTRAKFAEHHGITMDQAERLLNLASDVFHSPHPEA